MKTTTLSSLARPCPSVRVSVNAATENTRYRWLVDLRAPLLPPRSSLSGAGVPRRPDFRQYHISTLTLNTHLFSLHLPPAASFLHPLSFDTSARVLPSVAHTDDAHAAIFPAGRHPRRRRARERSCTSSISWQIMRLHIQVLVVRSGAPPWRGLVATSMATWMELKNSASSGYRCVQATARLRVARARSARRSYVRRVC